VLRSSREEAHISTSDSLVRVTCTSKHPLGPGPSSSIRPEEVVEDCCIEWIDSLAAVVVVVCFNLRALTLVGALSHRLDQQSVLVCKLSQRDPLCLQVHHFYWGNKSIELFLLVADTVLFYDDATGEMLKQIRAEVIRILGSNRRHPLIKQSCTLTSRLHVLV